MPTPMWRGGRAERKRTDSSPSKDKKKDLHTRGILAEVPSASPGHGPLATEMDGAEEDEELEPRLINPAPNNTERVGERQDSDSDTNPRDTGLCDGRDFCEILGGM
ncbi:hypothetical protein NDU88_008015 [Pleurodeles waltl]|uniref:Uncharacterized protein n=1 Tax=Pleurodeles waltl TaxID=8319 RepID=A0AAV7NXZ9_PLEWA|nr:hypothetical protein NDU88_008015 [Pleurodeles waltl]